MKGATQKDIEHHYDVSNIFFKKWLDSSMAYSAAKFDKDDETLHQAQINKINDHINNLMVTKGDRILDIGCGWGSLLDVASERGIIGHGLTLSSNQVEYVENKNKPGITIELNDWRTVNFDKPFDGVVSIGAFEHFTMPDISSEERIAIYREFFKKTASFIKDGGYLSLQTICFDKMREQDIKSFIKESIFPNSMLPRIQEIFAASDRIFTVKKMTNTAKDYDLTCEIWANNMLAKKDEIIEIVGEKIYNDYFSYLQMSSKAFRYKGFGLLRIQFQK